MVLLEAQSRLDSQKDSFLEMVLLKPSLGLTVSGLVSHSFCLSLYSVSLDDL